MLLVSGGRLYGFDTETGELGPSYATGFGQFAAPLVFEDSIILAGADGDIVRLTVEGREEVWRTAIRGTIWEKPLLAAGHLYAAGQQLICLAPESGLELWRWTPAAPSRLTTGVVAHGGTVFVGDDRGILYGLQGEYGEPKWRTHLEAPLSALRVVEDRLLAFTGAPALTCFTASGQRRLLWRYPSAQRLLTTVGEVAYVECEDGSVAALSLPQGEELWREPLPRDCVVAGDPARPVLYIGNQTGTIAAFEKLD
jgi:outer membrane protein assembly factor BamB